VDVAFSQLLRLCTTSASNGMADNVFRSDQDLCRMGICGLAWWNRTCPNPGGEIRVVHEALYQYHQLHDERGDYLWLGR
jgi:hypothetical protein